MIWTNTVDRHLPSVAMSSSSSLLLLFLIPYTSSQLLEIFGLSTGDAGTVDRQPFQDLASQSVGLINYLQTVQRNPNNQLAKKLREPLPTMNFMGGLPVVPGVMGSLPGAGSCLPRGAPLVRDKSPSFFQNILRNIPGAHDYLASLLPSPKVDSEALLGKYQWALDTPSVHNRFCATTEFQPTAHAGNSSSFSLQEKFRTQSEEGGEKVAFGYGILHNERTYVYMQDDPCPYQIVIVGPRKGGKGQYEYVILSNWARFPLIGLVRDIRVFYKKYKDQLEVELEKEGFINDYSGSASIHYADWSKCRPATPVSYIQNVLTELFG
ncbi:BMA-LPR-7 [Trichostrongylus colubriformis]|uniref:BMA-LPR-7 n=1 Tax=Trichostrongylus colubriformis TaxID=6319 RepID=A0AAN8FPQ4_TRICO